jgi:uncharacterized SAM-binding protein YcdF (DUF218 family)
LLFEKIFYKGEFLLNLINIVKEIFLSILLSLAITGIVTLIWINNPSEWYKAAKKISRRKKE